MPQAVTIIVCSIDLDRFNTFELNAKETIGKIDFEIIRVDNAKLQLPITKAYNYGADKAKYENLLFVHEDVLFHTHNWGELLVEELKDERVGLVGVAGSCYVPFAPCGFTNPVKKYNFGNIISNELGVLKRYSILPKDPFSLKALDGVFLATRKSIWSEFKFNEALDGFHGYDLDFSLRVSKKYFNKITPSLLIEHKSLGKLNDMYYRNLVVIKENIKFENTQNDPFNEYSAYRTFVRFMKIGDFSRQEFWSKGTKFISIKRFGMINSLKSFCFLLLLNLKD